MTIATTSNKAILLGDGLTTVFPFNFPVNDASFLGVTYTDANGAQTPLSNTQYSVTGIGNPNGGTVTYPLSGTPIAVGTKLTILRTVPYKQTTDLLDQAGYYPSVVEGALDYEMEATQQLTELVNRCIKVPVSIDTSVFSTELPSAALVPNAFLMINAAGTGITLGLTAGAIALPLGVGSGGTGAVSARAAMDNLFTHGADVVAAANLDLSATTGVFVNVTGNTGITGITLADGHVRALRFTGTPLITNSANLVCPGSGNIQVAAGDVAFVVGDAAGVVRIASFAPITKGQITPQLTVGADTQIVGADSTQASGLRYLDSPSRGMLAGCQLTWVSGTSITVGLGKARDDADTETMKLAAAITMSSMAIGWVVGNNQPKIRTGVVLANFMPLYFYVIKRMDTGVVDIFVSDESSNPTLPANYTKSRRIAAVRLASAATTFDKFFQNGDEFTRDVAFQDVNGNCSTANRTLNTVSVPPNTIAKLQVAFTNTGGETVTVYITDPAITDTAPSSVGPFTIAIANGNAGIVLTSCPVRCNTDSSSRIGIRGTSARLVTVMTEGWIDTRGRFA